MRGLHPGSGRRENLRFPGSNFDYLSGVRTLADLIDASPGLNQVVVPDLWQQEAVAGLRDGADVVVHAPTGAGKTLIFELWSRQGKNRGQAIYTVPTRALANDKLAEWRARGWNVGIATGDLAENLDAPILVATLETQKSRLIRGDGPALLVVDEYQMLGDPDRGLNYELALALAPPTTQLLLLSGSVGNPNEVVSWLRRLGRRVRLVRHEERPVPLEEVFANNLSYHVPSEVRGYWPRFVAKALAENLGPILLFAPRRQAAEALAAEIARHLPNPVPLALTPEQKQLVGEHLGRILRARVAYHHSGLSYAVRAGVIEPLAKAGQLRVVVATMGLAAGINFSLRSVALAGDSYRRDQIEQPLRADEILQMFGRAGRRGIDEIGYALVSANEIRLRDGHPTQLARSGLVDWAALLGVMSAAAEQGRDPFTEAVRVQQRLFSSKPIFLGVEESLEHPVTPCGLKTDAERARHVRRKLREMLNSRGEWERLSAPVERPLKDIVTPIRPAAVSTVALPSVPAADLATGTVAMRPVLSEPATVEKVGHGVLVVVEERQGHPIYGRRVTLADRLNVQRVVLAKWLRRLVNWHGRETTLTQWHEKIAPLVEQRMKQQRLPVLRFEVGERSISAVLSLAEQTWRVPVDRHGVAIWRPFEREVMPDDCAACALVPVCRQLAPAAGVAMLWRRLGLIDAAGVPTVRGRLVSFFGQGYGLAIAAAILDPSYPLDELIYDIANLDAGFRFCREEDRWAGRLPVVCRQAYGTVSAPGYLENGVPPRYGSGAEQIVAAIHKDPFSKSRWVTEFLGAGDIDRIIIEWRSLLRQISRAAPLEVPRWRAFQAMAAGILAETTSPTLTELPPLDYHQTRRVDHRLVFRRH
ncbi:MAG TPA: DEAD/DEAH box helicase [Methylomirabilota bacterium]|nr:DEAD/DEAH box helicase [Methylomirabilota bacterium]